MNKTNDVQKVREREGEEGERAGKNGPVYIPALLSLEEVFIRKSVSRAWWIVGVRARVRVYLVTRLCARSRRLCAHLGMHACAPMKLFACVFSARALLNYLQPELSNWYQVLKWGQMLCCSIAQLLLLASSLHNYIHHFSGAASLDL